jgi:hypothetical protein
MGIGQEREHRRAYLRAEVATIERHAMEYRDAGNGARALEVMREALTDWQGMLRQEPPHARHALQALLRGRLIFTPSTDGYTFEGPGTITPVIAGVVSKGGVAPTGYPRRWTWARSPGRARR